MKQGIQFSGGDQVAKNLQRWQEQYMNNLYLFAGALAGQLEAKAVRDRPWTDRTSAARNSIEGSHERKLGNITVALAIGVEYGKNLELNNGGKYRVIRPTIDSMRREFLKLPERASRVTKL